MSQTVLIIKEEAVLAVSGKEGKAPYLKEMQRAELTGYGEPVTRWREGIRALQGKMKLGQVRLVLPASVCNTKILQLPWVNKKDLAVMAAREMREAFRSEIMDYAVIHSDRKTGLLLACVSAEESMLAQLLGICKELGLEVKSVTAPMEGLLRLLPRLEAYQNKTAIYLFFEDGAVTSVLSETGQYKYSTRSRLFSEPGTLDFGTEIVRNISGILQFHATSKSENKITDVYYAGCPADVFEVSREGLANMNLSIAQIGEVKGIRLPQGADLSAVGAMLNNVREFHDINLLSSYRKNSEREEKEEKGSADWKHLILPLSVLALCAVIYGGVMFLNFRVQKQIDKTMHWIEAEDVQKKYKEAKALEKEKEVLLADIHEVRENLDSQKTYPKLDRTVVEKISAAGGAGIVSNISGYDAETGEMTFEARSGTAIDIPAYIRRLTQTELFHSVEYTGYVFENDAYTLSLLCTLKGNEGGDKDK